MMLYRALIKTRDMRSRQKIQAIKTAAKRFNCAVYLKTGVHPPGVMVGECVGERGEQGLMEWVRSVQVGGTLLAVSESAVLLERPYVPASSMTDRFIRHLTDVRLATKQRLYFKDYKLLRSERVEHGRLLLENGDVKEFGSMKALAHDLGESEVLDWWKLHMGFI